MWARPQTFERSGFCHARPVDSQRAKRYRGSMSSQREGSPRSPWWRQQLQHIVELVGGHWVAMHLPTPTALYVVLVVGTAWVSRMTVVPILVLAATGALLFLVGLAGSRTRARRDEEHAARLEARLQELEKHTAPTIQPAGLVGCVGYVGNLHLDWNHQDEEIRVRCWLATHVIGDARASYPRKLICGLAHTAGELCELKPLGEPTGAGTGSWAARAYEGSINAHNKVRLWRAIRAAMGVGESARQPSEGPVFVELDVRVTWDDDELGRGRLVLSPVGTTMGRGYDFVARIPNWNGVPVSWRLRADS